MVGASASDSIHSSWAWAVHELIAISKEAWAGFSRILSRGQLTQHRRYSPQVVIAVKLFKWDYLPMVATTNCFLHSQIELYTLGGKTPC
jgi:hypothetical protein